MTPILLLLTLSAEPLTLGNIEFLPKQSCAPECKISVRFKGDAPATMEAQDWAVSVVVGKTVKRIRPKVALAVASGGAIQTPRASIVFTFPLSDVGTAEDLANAAWTVLYLGDGRFQRAASNAPKAVDRRPVAKTRDESDLYLAGTAIAGQGTKPIYMLDAKVNALWVSHDSKTRAGLTAEILTNPGSEPPNDRSEADPDSIKAGIMVDRLTANRKLLLRFDPIYGEFARKYPASNIITAGRLQWLIKPPSACRLNCTVRPFAGYEFGANQNHPRVLFKRPVDIANYDKIGRAVLGADAVYRFWKLQSDDDPRFSLDANYIARIPFTDEPFTRLEITGFKDGKPIREKLLSLRRNTRHYVSTGITWNVTPKFGLQIKYQYGSLPPLFELVRSQVSVGLVYKSKLALF